MEEGGTGLGLAFWLLIGIFACLSSMLVLYNLVMVVSHLRSEYEEKSSPLALVAWFGSLTGLLFGPCGMVTSLIFLLLARIETGKIYSGDSTAASALPAAMASLNSVVVILLELVLTVAILLAWLG